MSNNKRLIQTIVISGIGTVIGYAISFFITPYIIEHLGMEAYGFVSIANSAVSYAGIITIALTSFVVRYISISFHEGRIDEARSFYSSSIIACTFLSLVLFLISVIVTLKIEHLLKISEALVSSVKILFIVVFINFVLNTITTPYSTAAYIKNRLDITGLIRIVAKIAEVAVIVWLFISFRANVWFVAVGTLVASIIILISNRIMTRKLTPELDFDKNLVSIHRIFILIKNGAWNSLNQLGNVLNSGLDMIISNLMLSGIETGQIGVGKTIGTIFSAVIQIVSQPFEPILIKSYASGKIEDFLKDMSKAMRVCGFFGAIAFAGFFAIGDSFIKLWLPHEDYRVLYILTILTVFNNITESILRPVYYISTLTVKNKIPCWITIAGGFLNVISMFILLRYTSIGVYGVVITTAVIMVTINLAFNPVYAAHCIRIKSKFFYKIIMKHLMCVALMSVVFRLFSKLIVIDSWVKLALAAMLLSIVGVLMYLIIMYGHEERNAILRRIKNTLLTEKQ